MHKDTGDLVYPTFKSKSTFHLKKKIDIVRCKVNDDYGLQI